MGLHSLRSLRPEKLKGHKVLPSGIDRSIIVFSHTYFAGLDLTLQEKRSVESMLRTHIHHLQEQLHNSSHGRNVSKNEQLLRQRIENLLDTLDNVVKTSDSRHSDSKELIEDLKKANRY